MNNDESEHQQTTHPSCLHGQKYYQHGAQWTSSVEDCYMCNCHYGRVACDLIVCPTVQCSVLSTKPGTCCPTCEGIIIHVSAIEIYNIIIIPIIIHLLIICILTEFRCFVHVVENAFENQSNSTDSCLLAGQQFRAGSSWHPYLPPNGFDTCTLCHCNVSVFIFLWFSKHTYINFRYNDLSHVSRARC